MCDLKMFLVEMELRWRVELSAYLPVRFIYSTLVVKRSV